jgi:hypothetical protein
MLKFIGWVVGIALFCWATVSAFSTFSELKFLVDGWTWSVDQVPISIKAVALAVGKYVSGIVGGYREFVHGLVQMLHLPRLPQVVYDMAGVVAFSAGRGLWVGRKVSVLVLGEDKVLTDKFAEASRSAQVSKGPWAFMEEVLERKDLAERYPLHLIAERIAQRASEAVFAVVV